MTPKYALLTLPKRLEEIHSRILDAYGLSREEVFIKGGDPLVIECRHVCIYVCLHLGMTGVAAAKMFNLSNHTSVLHARSKINHLTDTDEVFANRLKELIDNGDC
jgi:chromosomal replication initiation ATPase DnaA